MTIDDILQNDEAVDELSYDQIKDIYVRKYLMKLANKAAFDYEPRGKVVNPDVGTAQNISGIENILAEEPDGFLHDVVGQLWSEENCPVPELSIEDNDGNVELLFENMLHEHPDREQIVRDSIKQALRQSGVAEAKVCRKRLRHHLNPSE